MIAGKDYIYARKNEFGIVSMYLDEDCKQYYVNSLIYDNVVQFMEKAQNGSTEVFYL